MTAPARIDAVFMERHTTLDQRLWARAAGFSEAFALRQVDRFGELGIHLFIEAGGGRVIRETGSACYFERRVPEQEVRELLRCIEFHRVDGMENQVPRKLAPLEHPRFSIYTHQSSAGVHKIRLRWEDLKAVQECFHRLVRGHVMDIAYVDPEVEVLWAESDYEVRDIRWHGGDLWLLLFNRNDWADIRFGQGKLLPPNTPVDGELLCWFRYRDRNLIGAAEEYEFLPFEDGTTALVSGLDGSLLPPLTAMPSKLAAVAGAPGFVRAVSTDDLFLAECADVAQGVSWFSAQTGLFVKPSVLDQPLVGRSCELRQRLAASQRYWATLVDIALPGTLFGFYDLETRVFQPLRRLEYMMVERCSRRESALWVDEAGNWLYLVCEGQLIRLPLPPTA